jgi:hypothetical protein
LVEFAPNSRAADREVEREIAAALESVFPRVGLKALILLTRDEKTAQLMELAWGLADEDQLPHLYGLVTQVARAEAKGIEAVDQVLDGDARAHDGEPIAGILVDLDVGARHDPFPAGLSEEGLHQPLKGANGCRGRGVRSFTTLSRVEKRAVVPLTPHPPASRFSWSD